MKKVHQKHIRRPKPDSGLLTVLDIPTIPLENLMCKNVHIKITHTPNITCMGELLSGPYDHQKPRVLPLISPPGPARTNLLSLLMSPRGPLVIWELHR